MLDLSQVPDADIFREASKRMAARPGHGQGRPKKLSPCPKCGAEMGYMELRKHLPKCDGRASS
jgi:hypothetical protein